MSRTSAGHLIAVHRDEIIARWLKCVRREIAAARNARTPILVNTLPAFLNHLAEALAPDHPRAFATEGSTLAGEHGGERARTGTGRADDVVREYQLLREVLLEVLDEYGTITDAERREIYRSFDAATHEAATAYCLVQEGLREQFLLALVHDLRNPLTAVSTAAGLIVRKPDSPDVPRWGAKVLENVNRVEKMIRDLLDASRFRQSGRLQLELAECEMVAVTRAVIERLELSHGARFVVSADEPVTGQWSADALERALENLLTNAAKYGTSDTPITVRIERIDQRVAVSVHNHGSFIPLEEQETLFNAFIRRREAERDVKLGWGLGLALVRSVAEAHGGSVGVDSLREAGTTFFIDLPLDARPFQDLPVTPIPLPESVDRPGDAER